MSGFVGILHLDGAPAERDVLERLTASLRFRGPDAQNTWTEGPIGLGHTLLTVSTDTDPEHQPTSLVASIDSRLSIVADARIDGRSELITKLRDGTSRLGDPRLSCPDAELILHAYAAWGDCCVNHLLGDFCFAIWDGAKKTLFCARDQMGVKPFFYAQLGSLFIFSNTLQCLLRHPAVSKRLNDLAIADFLLFDANQDPTTTSFAEVQRLPAAHFLRCEQGNTTSQRYWELSVTNPVHYSHPREYVEHFLELMDTAVTDRLRSGSVGVLLSGGLDSSTVAASARRVLTKNDSRGKILAFTEVFDTLIPHEERHYSKLAADALGIPIEYLVSDNCILFENADQREYQSIEPTHSAWPDTTADELRLVAGKARVVLTGDGGDPVFSNRISVHFAKLLKDRHYGRVLSDALRFLTTEGRYSRLYLRKRWGILFAPKGQGAYYPEWLAEDLESRFCLRDRWQSLDRPSEPAAAVRPEAIESMTHSTWQSLFEMFDAGVSRVPVEVRCPFFDLRLVKYLLALPRLPWCSDKQLLREAGRGSLPDGVRLRRKSPLQADPVVALLKRRDSAWVDRFEPVGELGRYVVRKRVPTVCGEKDSWRAWISLRPLSLNFWLRGGVQSGNNSNARGDL